MTRPSTVNDVRRIQQTGEHVSGRQHARRQPASPMRSNAQHHGLTCVTDDRNAKWGRYISSNFGSSFGSVERQSNWSSTRSIVYVATPQRGASENLDNFWKKREEGLRRGSDDPESDVYQNMEGDHASVSHQEEASQNEVPLHIHNWHTNFKFSSSTRSLLSVGSMQRSTCDTVDELSQYEEDSEDEGEGHCREKDDSSCRSSSTQSKVLLPRRKSSFDRPASVFDRRLQWRNAMELNYVPACVPFEPQNFQTSSRSIVDVCPTQQSAQNNAASFWKSREEGLRRHEANRDNGIQQQQPAKPKDSNISCYQRQSKENHDPSALDALETSWSDDSLEWQGETSETSAASSTYSTNDVWSSPSSSYSLNAETKKGNLTGESEKDFVPNQSGYQGGRVTRDKRGVTDDAHPSKMTRRADPDTNDNISEQSSLCEDELVGLDAINCDESLTDRFKREILFFLRQAPTEINKSLVFTQSILSNVPIAIGALGMAWILVATGWSTYVDGLSSDATIPRHFELMLLLCKIVATFSTLCVVGKAIIAWRVLEDELHHPISAAPFGLLCSTSILLASDWGLVGQCLSIIISCLHVCFAVCFLSMVYREKMLPDPTWFPNTVGVAYAMAKTWHYNPFSTVLLLVCAVSFLVIFPLSLVRVHFSPKIAPTVCWMQMGAPSVMLYVATHVFHSSAQEGAVNFPNISTLQKASLHILFLLAMIGVASSVFEVWTRRKQLQEICFSPAHTAFAFPVVSHAVAVQAYYRMLIPATMQNNMSYVLLHNYCFSVLLLGTAATLVVSTMFCCYLPKWIELEISEEEFHVLDEYDLRTLHLLGDSFCQPFVSPSLLRANDEGVLVKVERSVQEMYGLPQYVRTRQVSAIGFVPTLDVDDLADQVDHVLESVETDDSHLVPHSMSKADWAKTYGSCNKNDEELGW